MRQERQNPLDAGMRLILRGPLRKLRQPSAIRAPRCIEITHHHVIKENVMQAARAQFAADQMGMDVEHRQFGQGLLHVRDQLGCFHRFDCCCKKDSTADRAGMPVCPPR